jgi:hypothetical protein
VVLFSSFLQYFSDGSDTERNCELPFTSSGLSFSGTRRWGFSTSNLLFNPMERQISASAGTSTSFYDTPCLKSPSISHKTHHYEPFRESDSLHLVTPSISLFAIPSPYNLDGQQQPFGYCAAVDRYHVLQAVHFFSFLLLIWTPPEAYLLT